MIWKEKSCWRDQNKRVILRPKSKKKTDPESFVDAVKVRKKNTGESIF